MERHLLLLGFILILSGVISYSPDETQLQAGQQQYQNALRESQMPRYGSCWRDALNLLQNGCKHLTDDVQRRLALHFANCFLEKAGRKTYPCADNADLKVCLRDIRGERNERGEHVSSLTGIRILFTVAQSPAPRRDTPIRRAM